MDKLGNAEADTAADIGRRHQTELLVDARPVFFGILLFSSCIGS